MMSMKSRYASCFTSSSSRLDLTSVSIRSTRWTALRGVLGLGAGAGVEPWVGGLGLGTGLFLLRRKSIHEIFWVSFRAVVAAPVALVLAEVAGALEPASC